VKLPRGIGRDLGFVALGLALFGVLYTPLGERLDVPFRIVAYRGVRALLALVAEPHQAVPAKFLLTHGTSSIVVGSSCSGLRAVALWSAFVAFVPYPWQRRALHFLLGATLLLVVNVVRLAHLFHLQVHHPAVFPLYHEWLWPAAKVALILAYWAVLILFYLHKNKLPPTALVASLLAPAPPKHAPG
jgi:exosortase/archaeosortase family protein